MHDRLVSRRIDALHQCFLVYFEIEIIYVLSVLYTFQYNNLHCNIVYLHHMYNYRYDTNEKQEPSLKL